MQVLEFEEGGEEGCAVVEEAASRGEYFVFIRSLRSR